MLTNGIDSGGVISRLRELLADEAGASIIELAVAAPVFALTIIGIVDMSNAYSRKLALQQGAQRAVEKIMQNSASDTVENTLTNEVLCQVNGTNPNGSCKSAPVQPGNVTIGFRLECVQSGGGISTQSASDSETFDAMTCDKGSTGARYVQVTVTDRYTPMFPVHFSGLDKDGTYHVTATAGARTQ